jgi:DNA-binding NarL/FixJ family response regulator
MAERAGVTLSQLKQSQFQVRPKRFVFYDKDSGTERFEVQADTQGRLPVEQAASLMAIHCFARGRTPKDFGVMITAEEDLMNDLLPVAKRLVEASVLKRMPVQLSHRQLEVLEALMEDGSNKEIAARLNISVRTVKFHVSALLEKLNVQSRVGLMRKASEYLTPRSYSPEHLQPRRRFDLMRANGEAVLGGNGTQWQSLQVIRGAERRASR